MNGRGFFGFLAMIVLLAIVVGTGIGIYNAGVNEGLSEAARAAVAAGEDPAVVVPPYAAGGYGAGHGYGWGGGGPGFFGILFGVLAIFLIFGLIRAAFGWGRHGGGRGPGGWESRSERMAEMHRELHKRDEPNAPAR